MWNRKNRSNSPTSRRHPSEAELEGIVRRGLAGDAPAPVPGRVSIRPQKQGFDPYDSRGASLRRPRRRGGRPGNDPYNTADRHGGRQGRCWD